MFTFYVLNGSEWTRKESKPIGIWFRYGPCYTIRRFYAFLCISSRVSKYAHLPMSTRAHSTKQVHMVGKCVDARARVCIYIILEIRWIYLTRYSNTNFQIMFCIQANIHAYIIVQGTRRVYIIKREMLLFNALHRLEYRFLRATADF